VFLKVRFSIFDTVARDFVKLQFCEGKTKINQNKPKLLDFGFGRKTINLKT